jgi:hypothetical protein
MAKFRSLFAGVMAAGCLTAQEPAPPAAPSPKAYAIEPGTRIPLNLMNAVSTRSAAEGDRIYLETIFPILADGRIVIPPGSYVAGTVTGVKRAGKVKGKAELYVRFDSLTLPNGVTRDFRARVGSLDGQNSEKLDRTEGKIQGDSGKADDAAAVAQATAWGATIGGVAARSGMGAGIGAAAGAAAGMMGVLFSRGPDAILERGSTLEMVLDRSIKFTPEELDFSNAMPARRPLTDGGQAAPSKNRSAGPVPIPRQ